jgi:transposase
MPASSTIFSQIMEHLPWWKFQRLVKEYQGDYKVQSFRCSDHFKVMAFAQLTYRDSLRDIEVCLRAMSNKLYHMGIRSTISRNNLANANETRDWRIYADFAKILIAQAKSLYVDEPNIADLESPVFAIDSTTIDLCMSLFPWAHFRKTKSSVKMHIIMDLRGNIPDFIHITEGKLHDVNVLDQIIPQPGAYYVMDRGYLDFQRLYNFHTLKSYFVTRSKKNIKLTRTYSSPVDRATGIMCDQTVVLTDLKSREKYPEKIRRVKYRDPDGKILVFLTNDFSLPAMTIANLYKSRWQIELFFRWIKQHLRIKSFYGNSINAVKTQIWIAICAYTIVAIIKKRLKIRHSLYTILQILSVSIFERTPILQVFESIEGQTEKEESHNMFILSN